MSDGDTVLWCSGRLWNIVNKGTDNEEDDMSALEAILAAVPAEYREPLGAKSLAKKAWEAIMAMRKEGNGPASEAGVRQPQVQGWRNGERLLPPPIDAHQQAKEPRRHHRRT